MLARAQWSFADAKAFHHALCSRLWPGGPDFGTADSEVKSTFDKVAAGTEVTGLPTLIEIIDKKVVDTALRWLGIDRAQRRHYLWNDTGNAVRLMDLHGHELIHCTERRSYYVWTGQQWQLDEFVEVEKRAEETMLGAFADAKNIADSDKRGILKICQSVPVTDSADQYDAPR